MKHAWAILGAALAASALASAATAAEAPGQGGGAGAARFVHADGTQIVDADGKALRLRGVNLGGWLLWEGWIWGGGYDSETALMRRLGAVLGDDGAAAFRRDLYARFITEKDIARIAATGFNVVRVPFNHKLLEDDTKPYVYKDDGWRVLDALLDACGRHGVYVVLDLCGAAGGLNSEFCADPDPKTLLWDSEADQARTVALWRAIAARYKDRRILAGYDLLDEPIPPDGPTLVRFYQRIAAAVREVDPHHMLILEGADVTRDLSMFTGPVTANQAYSLHINPWTSGGVKGLVARLGAVARSHKMPLWVGEFGEDKADATKGAATLFDDPQSGVAGWCYWTWKKVPNKYPGLLAIDPPAKWQSLIGWVAGNFFSRKPSAEDAAQAVKEFLEAVECDRNKADPAVVEMLGGKK